MAVGREIGLYPLKGLLDIDKIKEFLNNFEFTLQHPKNLNAYLITENQEKYLSCVIESDKIDEKHLYPESAWIAIVMIHETGLSITTFHLQPLMKRIKIFIEWMLNQYECKVRDDDYGNDLTDEIKQKGLDVVLGLKSEN